MSGLEKALHVATEVARAAGELIRRETWRPDGPRGYGHHADVDDEAEALIRGRLLHAFPSWSYYGEETGLHVGADPFTFWLVDPNDGTHAFLRGYRGSSVSIALIRDGLPVLGVVYAPCAPDDDGDLIAWAEGCGPLTRNGRALDLPPLPATLDASHVVLVSHAADGATEANLACCAPARFRALPSIALRLALVASGDAHAAVSHGGPGWLDVAGGHALLRGRGGELTDRDGAPVRYPRVGNEPVQMCFGGALPACARLARGPWDAASGRHSPPSALLYPVRLESPRRRLAPALLSRAQGTLLGHLAGASLGSGVQRATPTEIRAAHGEGPRDLADGGPWDTLAGQPSGGAELALALARTLLERGSYDDDAVLAAYRAWYGSRPFDSGEAALAHSERATNGSLVRVAWLGVAAHADPERAAALAARDARLTHPHPMCAEAAAVLARAVAVGIAGGTRDEMYRAALGSATHLTRDALERASFAPPPEFTRDMASARIALHNGFHRLLHATSLEEGLIETVREGGDATANGAIAGALLGACHGHQAVPSRWRRDVLSCRATPAFAPTCQPRPPWCWPVDTLEIAERLLCLEG